jgi:hypothetical protein
LTEAPLLITIETKVCRNAWKSATRPDTSRYGIGGPKVVAEHLRGLLGRVEHGLTSHLAREPGSDRRGQVRTYGLTDLSPGRDVGLTPLRPEVERMGLDHFLASGTT